MVLEFAVREVFKASGKTIGKKIARQFVTSVLTSVICNTVSKMITSDRQDKCFEMEV